MGSDSVHTRSDDWAIQRVHSSIVRSVSGLTISLRRARSDASRRVSGSGCCSSSTTGPSSASSQYCNSSCSLHRHHMATLLSLIAQHPLETLHVCLVDWIWSLPDCLAGLQQSLASSYLLLLWSLVPRRVDLVIQQALDQRLGSRNQGIRCKSILSPQLHVLQALLHGPDQQLAHPHWTGKIRMGVSMVVLDTHRRWI